jgi:serine-type D-Ala-D-Ala carboxypeptidase/endopeptidase
MSFQFCARRPGVAAVLAAVVVVALSNPHRLYSQAAAPPQGQSTSVFPDDRALLDLITTRVRARRATGIVLGVMDADGTSRIVSYGNPGPGAAPLGPNTVFEIGSITKVFTSTVLATMAARSEVSLDAPVRRYLPSDLAPPERNGVAITLAHLSEQNSGLPQLPANFAPKDAANPWVDYSVEDLSRYFSTLTLSRMPGERYEYTNLGVGLLGMALSRQAGMSYEELVAERVLRPLGMTNTGIRSTLAMARARAIGHDQQGAPTADWQMSVPFEAAGALRSTIIDLLKFLDANIGPPKNDLERAMRMAHEPRAAAGSSRIGLNWMSSKTPGGVNIVYHSGNTGGFSAYVGFDPVRGVGVVMLTNQAATPLDIPVHLLDPTVPLREAQKTPAELGAITLPVGSLSRLVGTYVLDSPPRLRFTVTVEADQLYVDAPGLGRLAFHPRTPLQFFNVSLNAQIAFVENQGGQVSGVTVKMAGIDQAGTRID